MAVVTKDAAPSRGDDGRRLRSGRRPGATETRNDILQAARKLFAENGYGGTTMRMIAHEAQVDAALIHHFFVSKEGVFAAAIEDSYRLPEHFDDLLGGDRDGLGERLVRGFLELWTDPATRDPMFAVIRSVFSYDEAARLLRTFITERLVARIAPDGTQEDVRLRATLIGSQLVGAAILRHVVKVEPLASAEPAAIAKFMGPAIDRYLADDLEMFR